MLVANALGFAAPPAIAVILQWSIVAIYPLSLGNFAALALALLGISAAVPTLVTAFFSGTIADRSDRRRLLRWSNAAALVGTGVLAVVLYYKPTATIALPGPVGFFVPLWVVLAFPLWGVVTVTNALARPTYNAALPQIVPGEQLGRANGLVLTTGLLVSAVGALGVGFMVGPLGPVIALLVPLAFFEIAGISLATLRVDLTGSRTGPRQSFLSDARDGFRYFARRRGLLEITLAALAINFLGYVAAVEIPLYVRSWLQQGPEVLGAMTFIGAVGAAVGSSAVNWLRYEHRAGTFLPLFVVLQGLALLVLPLTHSPLVALAAIFLFGLFPGMFITVFLVVVQRTVPNEIRGRVFAADEVGSFAMVPLGQYAGGIVTAAQGIRFAYLVAAGGITGTGAVMAGLKDLRRFASGSDTTGLRGAGPVGGDPRVQARPRR